MIRLLYLVSIILLIIKLVTPVAYSWMFAWGFAIVALGVELLWLLAMFQLPKIINAINSYVNDRRVIKAMEEDQKEN
jgi:membrane protein implicated in regulation of membrane protease activity